MQLILHDCCTHESTLHCTSCNKQLVTGCESREYFCIKTCTCCAYYLLRANLFCSKRRTSCLWRDFPRSFVQSEVSIHATRINPICCRVGFNVGGEKSNIAFQLVLSSNVAKQVAHFCCLFYCSLDNYAHVLSTVLK